MKYLHAATFCELFHNLLNVRGILPIRTSSSGKLRSSGLSSVGPMRELLAQFRPDGCRHVAQSTVSKYMVPRRGRSPQGRLTFLRNNFFQIAAIDMLAVRTNLFECLYVFVVLGLGRRTILHAEVTTNPTARKPDHRSFSVGPRPLSSCATTTAPKPHRDSHYGFHRRAYRPYSHATPNVFPLVVSCRLT